MITLSCMSIGNTIFVINMLCFWSFMTRNMLFQYVLPKHIKSALSNSYRSSIFGFLTGKKKKEKPSWIVFAPCISCAVNHNLNVEKKIELSQIMWNKSFINMYCTQIAIYLNPHFYFLLSLSELVGSDVNVYTGKDNAGDFLILFRLCKWSVCSSDI